MVSEQGLIPRLASPTSIIQIRRKPKAFYALTKGSLPPLMAVPFRWQFISPGGLLPKAFCCSPSGKANKYSHMSDGVYK
jgi:hypothetical protein